jgi:hypothetical protein
LMICLTVPIHLAAMTPRDQTQRSIQDPSMMFKDRGSLLEVLPKQRVLRQIDSSGRSNVQVLTTVDPSAPMGPLNLGVVFNHTIQKEGYINGEITFRVKRGQRIGDFDKSRYPGLKLILDSNVFVVTARTPADFMNLLKRLQNRADLVWVEPNVVYRRSNAP